MLGRISLLFLGFVAVLVPSAFAQLPATSPSAQITLEGLPAEGDHVTGNQTFHLIDMSVRFQLQNVVCSGSASVPVLLSGFALPSGNGTGNGSAAVHLTTERLEFEVPPGAYTTSTSIYASAKDVTLSVATNEPPPGGSFNVAFMARMEADANRYGCGGSGALPMAAAQRNFTIDYAVLPPPGPAPTPTTKVPGPGLALALVALTLAAAFRLRPRP